MNILVLMPIDEQHSISSMQLMLDMGAKKGAALPLASYADYLVSTHLAKNWEEASLKALISVDEYMRNGEKHHVIIGNAPKGKYRWDLIVSFDDGEVFEAYEDRFLEKIKKNYKEKEFNPIIEMLNSLYTKDDCKMILINSKASGEFLSKYLDTEIKIDEHLREQLKSKIKFWKIG